MPFHWEGSLERLHKSVEKQGQMSFSLNKRKGSRQKYLSCVDPKLVLNPNLAIRAQKGSDKGTVDSTLK